MQTIPVAPRPAQPRRSPPKSDHARAVVAAIGVAGSAELDGGSVVTLLGFDVYMYGRARS